MSDLYVELRTRIPVVAARTHLGKQRIEDAQRATGLSNEAVARRVPVSEKTWRRWKEKGEVPTAALPAVATALALEMVDLNAAPPGNGDEAALDLDDLRKQVQDLTEEVGRQSSTLSLVLELLQRRSE